MNEGFARESIKKLDLILTAAVVGFLFLILFRLPYFPFYYEADHLIFLENADRMMNGQAIYRDFFQFTFPGGQSLYLLFFKLFGAGYWISGALGVVIGTLTFWILLRISRSILSSPLAYLPPLVLIFFGFRWFGLTAGVHWTASSLLIWVAILCLLRDSRPTSLAKAGLACAAASFFLQQRGFEAMIGLAVFALIEVYATGWNWRTLVKEELILGASFVGVLLALCGYFVLSAGPDNFIWATFTYPAKYYHYYEYNNPGASIRALQNAFAAPHFYISEFAPGVFYLVMVPLALIAFPIFALVRRKKVEWNSWRVPTLLACVGIPLVFFQTNPSHSRLYHIAGPSMILLAWFIERMGVAKRTIKIATAVAMAGLLAIGVVLAVYFQLRSDYTRIEMPRGTVYMSPEIPVEKYLWLRERTVPGDYVFEGTQPYMDLLLGLRPCCRYTQFVPTDYTRPEFVTETITDIERTKPRFIVWDEAYLNAENGQRQPGDHLGPLVEYLQNNYEPTGPTFKMEPRMMRIWIRKAE